MYYIEVRHEGLKKYRNIQGSDKYIVEQKAAMLKSSWNEMWIRRLETERKKREQEKHFSLVRNLQELAAERTQEAQQVLKEHENFLNYTLNINDAIKWDSLLSKADFFKSKPKRPEIIAPTREPLKTDQEFQPKFNFFALIFSGLKQKKILESYTLFEKAHQKWAVEKLENESVNKAALVKFQRDLLAWEEEKEKYFQTREEGNAKIIEKKEKYLSKNADSILDYCEMVLANSKYPENFPQQYELDYEPENKRLLVDYFLPSIDNLPTLKEVRYIKKNNQFKEVHISEKQLNELYDNVMYQITLRTIHELYEADVVEGLSIIIFNGFVRFVDKRTGKEAISCILSIQVQRGEFLQIDLSRVDPKSCFKAFKGIGSSKLYGMVSVAPILQMNREDKRFVSSYGVVESIDSTTNIAAMDWRDFENLIRELFEKEFLVPGAEVKITRASRDEGVDAVIFDPDPLHGGKIVIQAKRYTNTVGVSAVRDLYGTVLNEGAMKGILVTTTDYGPDAYKFAQDKPLTLLNGGNLLHLLEKHGHKAKIDIKEAKKILGEKLKD